MKLFPYASLLILLFAACLHIPAAQTPSAIVAGKPLVVLQTSGGFVATDEVLTVFKDGKIEFTDNVRNHRGETRVRPEQIKKLQELISKPEYQQLQSPLWPGRGADFYVYRITTWTNDGKEHTVTATDLNLPDILSQVISEMNALRRMIR
jgi:hypothetical protein